PSEAIVVIGDSRVDGIGTSPGADRRWTDALAERLVARGGRTQCVVNQGIGGNRMLNDGVGTAALARFDRDVLATPGLGHVVIAVGNDLVFSFAPRTEESAAFLDVFPGAAFGVVDIITAHLQLSARARDYCVTVHAASIAPYGGSDNNPEASSELLEQINT